MFGGAWDQDHTLDTECSYGVQHLFGNEGGKCDDLSGCVVCMLQDGESVCYGEAKVEDQNIRFDGFDQLYGFRSFVAYVYAVLRKCAGERHGDCLGSNCDQHGAHREHPFFVKRYCEDNTIRQQTQPRKTKKK